MSGKFQGYARRKASSDAYPTYLETQRRLEANCEQILSDGGSGASWSRPGLIRLKAALQPGNWVKVAALGVDRWPRFLS